MQLCFIDEAGDLGALRDPPASNDQPVLVVAGLFVDALRLRRLTDDYLDLKHRFFPDLSYPSIRRLDRILPEIKGAKLRKNAIRGNARQTRRGAPFLLSRYLIFSPYPLMPSSTRRSAVRASMGASRGMPVPSAMRTMR